VKKGGAAATARRAFIREATLMHHCWWAPQPQGLGGVEIC